MKISRPLFLIYPGLILTLFLTTVACESSSPYVVESHTIMEKRNAVMKAYNDNQSILGPKIRQGDADSTKLLIKIIEEASKNTEALRVEWLSLTPPKNFLEFHLLVHSGFNNFIEATRVQITIFNSILLTGQANGIQAERGSKLLKTSNDEFIEAMYLFRGLTQ